MTGVRIRRLRRWAAALAGAALALTALPAAAGTVTFDVGLAGPADPMANAPVVYGGRVVALATENPVQAEVGAPLAPVELLLDGVTVASTMTDITGSYGAAVSVPPGGHTLVAVAFRGTEGESRSEPLGVTGVVPDPPVLSATEPAGPSVSERPWVIGTAQRDATVNIYTDSSCAGPAAATGRAWDGRFSIRVSVERDSTTTFRATARDAAGNISGCSSTALTYVNDVSRPVFAGLERAVPGTGRAVNLSWSPATDNVTTSAVIRYEICRATTATGCSSFTVHQTTVPGATSAVDFGDADTRYWYSVRAVDEAGNADRNGVVETVRTNAWSASVLSVTGGSAHSCALLADGQVQCWGLGSNGRLGNGSTTTRRTPVPVSGTGDAVRAAHVSAGVAFTCMVTARGGAACWGTNTYGQLGDGTTTDRLEPVPVIGLGGAVAQVAAGQFHACALMADGTVGCWGNNVYGQAGFIGSGSTTAVPVAGLEGVTEIAAGDYHSCARLADGRVTCWGADHDGQLGNGSGPSGALAEVTGIGGGAPATSIALGGRHSCALLASGEARCWGRGLHGQLGDGRAESSAVPVAVTGLAGAVAITAGSFHTCALMPDGSARCWGNNASGRLGDGTTTSAATPVIVKGLSAARSIGAGGSHTCATGVEGGAWCWGDAGWHQLGYGGTADRWEPTTLGVWGQLRATGVTAGGLSSCSRLSDGSVRCWGLNSDGQLGDGSTDASRVPVVVDGLGGARAVSAGDNHVCGVTTAGGVRCWGANSWGQLGNGTTDDSPEPVEVPGLTGVHDLAAAQSATCAVHGDGAVSCWGLNSSGQLGSPGPSSPAPVAVPGIPAAAAVTAGTSHVCALAGDGGVWCWGANHSGQLGNGSTANSGPAAVALGMPARAVVAGFTHTCATLADGTVRCWGRNIEGQLGDGTTTGSNVPAVSGAPSPSATLFAGGYHACGAAAGETPACWGANWSGQLGDGGTDGATEPRAVSGLGPIRSGAGGSGHTCALAENATVWCWGSNSHGQLGEGTVVWRRLTPTAVVSLP